MSTQNEKKTKQNILTAFDKIKQLQIDLIGDSSPTHELDELIKTNFMLGA